MENLHFDDDVTIRSPVSPGCTADLIPLQAVISTIFFLNEERKFVENVVLMDE